VPLADTVLTAPFTAVVVARHIERGSTVAAGTVAYTLADLRQVKVRFGVPDMALRGLPTGSTMRMDVESVPSQHYLAHVIGVAPAADPATRLFGVQALASNPRGLLKAGMVASIVADTPGEKSLPAVPLRSIRKLGEANRFAVLTVEGDVLQLREVTLGPAQGSLMGIQAGLRPGELVVDDAGTGLRAGDKVRTIPQPDTQ
jgi:HlyD family secretion protein